MTRIPFRRTAKRISAKISRMAEQIGVSMRQATPVVNVMTSCGGPDSDIAQVLIKSLSLTQPNDRINFWFFYLDVPDTTLAVLKSYCDSLGNVRFHPVQVQEAEAFDELRVLGGKPDAERFLWFMAHRYLPAKLDRVLYIDALDAIAVDNIRPFLFQSLGGKYVAACREGHLFTRHPLPSKPPAIEAFRNGESLDGLSRMSRGLFNSGTMVINLKKMRKDGLDIEFYARTARWAAQEMGLSFGDQGLFSLTHGSNFKRAADRYNYRFFAARAATSPIVPGIVHFVGHIRKPFRLCFTPEQETAILGHLARHDIKYLSLPGKQQVWPHYFAHYRAWWDICKTTPVHDRIAAPAQKAATEMVERMRPRAGP